jgi:DNA-binding transcriptional ArsR family regulator
MEFANPSKDDEELARRPGLQSSMETITAKNAGAGTGAKLVHVSELGLYETNQIDAKTVLDTLLQIVPLAPRTVIAIESTARGVGNEFHIRWKQAERSFAAGLDDFYPFFISWLEEPENRIEGVDWDALEGLDEREERLRDRYKAMPEQLAWRRYFIRSQFAGDSDRFDQEYPESADVAFLSSGRPFFDNEVVSDRLDELASEEREPVCVGDIVEADGLVTVQPRPRGRLKVWEAPEDGDDYVIVCDPSEGSAGDPQDAVVLARSSLKEVASWHGHIDRGDLGDVLYRLGYLYNTALVTVERQGGWGLTPLNVLKRRGYPRIHRRKEEGKKRERRTVRLGFDMTETNRALVLDALREAVTEGEFDSPTVEFYKECLVFEYGQNGKPQASTGENDDRVISRAIAVYMWQTEPRRRRVQPPKPEVFSGLTGY